MEEGLALVLEEIGIVMRKFPNSRVVGNYEILNQTSSAPILFHSLSFQSILLSLGA